MLASLLNAERSKAITPSQLPSYVGRELYIPGSYWGETMDDDDYDLWMHLELYGKYILEDDKRLSKEKEKAAQAEHNREIEMINTRTNALKSDTEVKAGSSSTKR